MKQILQLSQMLRLIMIVTLIVMLGGLFGTLMYFVNMPPKINLPVINPLIKDEIIIITDKTEYEQGEKIIATLDYTDYKNKIYQWDRFAWSIQKMENGLWIDIKREDSPEFYYTNISNCKNINLNDVEECPDVWLFERAGWYEIKDVPKLFWDQSYKIEEKTFSCNFIQRHTITNEITSSKIENRSCAVFAKVQPGNYKIRFEYAVDIGDPFDRNINIKYAEKEFTIKEKRSDITTIYDNCDVVEKVGSYTEIKGIITESDPDYNNFRQQCMKINGCSWQLLGGKAEKHYACCPINFKDNKNEQVWLRCGIAID